MRRIFILVLLLIFGVFPTSLHTALGQPQTREFAYGGVTYRYRLLPKDDSLTYELRIQALKDRTQGTTVYQGQLTATFRHPKQWRITIYGAQKKKSGWVTQTESYVETTFDLRQRAVFHFDNGEMVSTAEQELTENFSGEWEQINPLIALAVAVEYFIINYQSALGKHDIEAELETEEVLMLNQMMAERQAQRDSLVAAIAKQRQQVLNPTDSTVWQTAADSALQTVAKMPVLNDSAAVGGLSVQTLSDSSSVAETTLLPVRLEGDFELPFVGKLTVENQIYFLEARWDELNRIELKIRRYNADSNRTELVYVSYVRIKDSTEQVGRYQVYIHFSENNGYEWKSYPNSFLECSLDAGQRKLCYRTVGSLIQKLQDPEHPQKEEELDREVVQLHKQEIVLAAARYFVAHCSKALK